MLDIKSMHYKNFVPVDGKVARLFNKPKRLSWVVFLSSVMFSPFIMANNDDVEPEAKSELQSDIQSKMQTLSLTSSIVKTLKEHPSLQVFKFRQLALQGQLQQQSLAPAFELGFEVENFAGSGPYSELDQAEYTISLSWIFLF
jgi:hypothetical protein